MATSVRTQGTTSAVARHCWQPRLARLCCSTGSDGACHSHPRSSLIAHLCWRLAPRLNSLSCTHSGSSLPTTTKSTSKLTSTRVLPCSCWKQTPLCTPKHVARLPSTCHSQPCALVVRLLPDTPRLLLHTGSSHKHSRSNSLLGSSNVWLQIHASGSSWWAITLPSVLVHLVTTR